MAQYVDFTSAISVNKSNDYVSLGAYNDSTPNVPQSSLLKLTVAPGSNKYFDAAPAFEQRLDNFRIPAPAQYPINLVDNEGGYNPNTQGGYALAGPVAGGSDYSTLSASYRRR
jgi:hypothetical protein